MRMIKGLLQLAILVGLVMWGIKWIRQQEGEGNAHVRNVIPGGVLRNCHCWVTLEFGEPPPGLETRGVRIEISGGPVANPGVFDWGYIASNAKVPGQGPQGRVKAPNVSVLAAPPLKSQFDVDFPVALRPAMSSDADFDIIVTLYWGGIKQDRGRASVRHLYRAAR